jgi:hypothetical protein
MCIAAQTLWGPSVVAGPPQINRTEKKTQAGIICFRYFFGLLCEGNIRKRLFYSRNKKILNIATKKNE